MKLKIIPNIFSKFNWLFLGVICILLTSCKDKNVNTPAKTLTDTNKQTKAKKKDPFYDFLRLNNNLDQSDINNIKAISKKYNRIKKQNKWAGESNKATRKRHVRKQEGELKRTLDSRYQILQKERKRWRSKSKKTK